jgi:hypothetical protein
MIGAEATGGWPTVSATPIWEKKKARSQTGPFIKKAVYFNAINTAHDPMAAEYGAKSMLAVP